MSTADAAKSAGFRWIDQGRFVEVHPVATGWLVLWGRYADLGRTRMLDGNRTYRDLLGVRRRVADAVLSLTGNHSLVVEAVQLFDRFPFGEHGTAELPEPL